MDFRLLIVLFPALTALLWSISASEKKANGRRKADCRHEEFSIDPATVPEFKPRWPESR
jgi:hypothetical protein